MKLRNDLLPPGIHGPEVVQLTTGDLPSSHVYMEAQIFTPDSRRFILHESAHPHGGPMDDSRHRYLICDLENDCSLSPVTEERNATAPSVSPDGRYLYYFIDETVVNGGRFALNRVKLDGTDRQTLLVLDSAIPGTRYRASRLYPLSTIRSDGKRIALACFLGDRQAGHERWGVLVIDLEVLSVALILEGPSWCNIHPQYCRSTDPAAQRDILVQENHGNSTTETGEIIRLTDGNGADIHVIKDDGSDFRNLPWGRDGNEYCQGHQCWRGRTTWAITSTSTLAEQQLIESQPVLHTGHDGLLSPGGVRNHLSRSFTNPCFSHFATDINGRLLVTDSKADDQTPVFLARLNQPGGEALSSWTPVALARSSWQKDAHIHPFLSPDGTKAFFNSDESGILQAYMVRGMETV